MRILSVFLVEGQSAAMASATSKTITITIGCILLLALLVGDRLSRSSWLFIEQSPKEVHIIVRQENHTTTETDLQPIDVIQHNRTDSHVDSLPIDETLHNQSKAMITNERIENNETKFPTVKFIQYPHNTLGSGADMQCHWETTFVSNRSAYDYIQLSAFEEGICIPKNPNVTIHIFSSVEAKQCLNSKRVVISGDSYMRQLFVGLADILLGKKLKNDAQIINGSLRTQFVETANHWLSQRHKKDESFPIAEYSCEQPCYGRDTSFSKICSECINSFTLEDEQTVAVVGAGVHIMNRLGKDVNATAREIDTFLNLTKRTIFVSMPSYQLEKVPDEYKEASSVRNNLYGAVLPLLAPRNPDHPFLDVYQLTRSCTMNNCSYDGGHRSRYVNRWKAQLLLNTLCEVVE